MASNYRSISLLPSFYKIYMTLIRERIQSHTEKIITNPQYGFRPAKSTAHAIFMVKRIQDCAEKKTGSPLLFTRLDWEKAFDKNEHNFCCEALRKRRRVHF